MDELQLKIKNHLITALETISSPEEQIAYKNAVSFVHVPYELICQWDQLQKHWSN